MIEVKKISVSTSPYLKDTATTPKIMMMVVYTLIPVVMVSIYYFGLAALLVTLTAVFSCMFTEWLFESKKNLLRIYIAL